MTALWRIADMFPRIEMKRGDAELVSPLSNSSAAFDDAASSVILRYPNHLSSVPIDPCLDETFVSIPASSIVFFSPGQRGFIANGSGQLRHAGATSDNRG